MQDPEVGAVDVDDEHVGLVPARPLRRGVRARCRSAPTPPVPSRRGRRRCRGGRLLGQRVGLEPVSAPAKLGERGVVVPLSVGGTDLDERATANVDALEQRRDQAVLAVLEELRSLRRVQRRDRSRVAWTNGPDLGDARSASACCRRGRSPRRDASARRALRRRPDNTERSGGKGLAFVSLRTVMEPATLRPEQGFRRPGRSTVERYASRSFPIGACRPGRALGFRRASSLGSGGTASCSSG